MEKRAIAKLSASVAAVGLAACALTGVFGGGDLIWQAPPAVNETHEEASAPAEAVKQKAVPADPERLMRTRPEFRMIPDNAGENGAPAEMPAEAGPADPERLMRTRPEIRMIPGNEEENSVPAGTPAEAGPADQERLMRTRPEIRMIPGNEEENSAPAGTPAEAGPADPERLMRTRPEIREIPAEAEESGTAAEAENTEKNETTESAEPDASRFMRSRPSF